MSSDKSREILSTYRNVINDLRTFHPVSGSFEAGEDYTVIKGDALGEGTWNMFYYPAEELKKATDSLAGAPLVIGHGKSESDEVGKVTGAHFNDDREVVEFEAEVESEDVAQLIKRNVIDSVSVGVEFDEEMHNNKRVATNLEFYELALVKEPAYVDGIKEIISNEVPDEEMDELNELSQGGENLMSEEKALMYLPDKIYEELSDKDEVKVLYKYPSYKGYYPSAYGYPYGYYPYYPKYKKYYGYKYPYSSEQEKEENYGYPYGGRPGPDPLTLTFKEIFRRVDQIADEIGVDFESKYPYPKPEYPAYTEQEQESEEMEVLAVEVDEDKAESIMNDLSDNISELVDEVGYPGPESKIADILENINGRLESLEKELGL